MTATPEQIVAASKANVEAGLKSASAFVTTVFTAAERVATLNLATARTAFDDSVAFSKAVLAAKDPKAVAALNLGAVTPAVDTGFRNTPAPTVRTVAISRIGDAAIRRRSMARSRLRNGCRSVGAFGSAAR